MSKELKGWAILSVGACMVSVAFGMAWTIPVGLAIGGVWVAGFGISIISGD